MSFFKKILGNDPIKPLNKIADQVEALEQSYAKLTDEELRGKTQQFKDRLKQGETLDDLLPEAFAAVREASVRTTGMKHFRVQVLGGIVLHQGRIAEMRTGEGKTLVATLPAYLNALEGKGVPGGVHHGVRTVSRGDRNYHGGAAEPDFAQGEMKKRTPDGFPSGVFI